MLDRKIISFQIFLHVSLCYLMIHTSMTTMAQCTSTVKFPSLSMSTSYNDTTIVTTTQHAGQFFVIKNLVVGMTYEFTSSGLGDYFSIRNAANPSLLLISGIPPLTYTATGLDSIAVHVNLLSPPCGADNVNRTTKVRCTNCLTSKAIVTSMLLVNGRVKVGNEVSTNTTGMVRWNQATKDFEGYNGAKWVSFTKENGEWGLVQNEVANENKKVTASDGASVDQFGYSVAIDGDYAIIGSHFDDVGSNVNQGSAYIYKRNASNDWLLHAKLTASDGAANDQFGASVAISGDFVIIGSPFDDISATDEGSAYIFQRNGSTWSQTKLTASDKLAYDNFGWAVGISSDNVVIGSPYNGNMDVGAAYVFHRINTTWTQIIKLADGWGQPGTVSNFFYGSTVAISNDDIVVGCPECGFDQQGVIYIYHFFNVSWLLVQEIEYNNSNSEDYGSSLAISDSLLIVGDRRNDNNGQVNYGAAYIYKKTSNTNWSISGSFFGENPEDNFGYAVSISGDKAVVGSIGHDIDGNVNQGAAYTYSYDGSGWAIDKKLVSADRGADNYFGSSVGVSGNHIIVGCPNIDIGAANDQGAAYFFRK